MVAGVSFGANETLAQDEDAGVRRRAIGSRVAAASVQRSSEVRVDRFFGQLDWGGLSRALVEESITRLSTEIAPAVRGASA